MSYTSYSFPRECVASRTVRRSSTPVPCTRLSSSPPGAGHVFSIFQRRDIVSRSGWCGGQHRAGSRAPPIAILCASLCSILRRALCLSSLRMNTVCQRHCRRRRYFQSHPENRTSSKVHGTCTPPATRCHMQMPIMRMHWCRIVIASSVLDPCRQLNGCHGPRHVKVSACQSCPPCAVIRSRSVCACMDMHAACYIRSPT